MCSIGVDEVLLEAARLAKLTASFREWTIFSEMQKDVLLRKNKHAHKVVTSQTLQTTRVCKSLTEGQDSVSVVDSRVKLCNFCQTRHDLGLREADCLLSCFTLGCKPSQCKLNLTAQTDQQKTLRFPNLTSSSP